MGFVCVVQYFTSSPMSNFQAVYLIIVDLHPQEDIRAFSVQGRIQGGGGPGGQDPPLLGDPPNFIKREKNAAF